MNTTDRDPETYCHRCNGPNVSWHAPSPLWNAVMRQGDKLLWSEVICPTCFAVLAEEAGVADMAEGWRLDARSVLTELQTVGPDGRVWDSVADLWREPALPAEASDSARLTAELRATKRDYAELEQLYIALRQKAFPEAAAVAPGFLDPPNQPTRPKEQR